MKSVKFYAINLFISFLFLSTISYATSKNSEIEWDQASLSYSSESEENLQYIGPNEKMFQNEKHNRPNVSLNYDKYSSKLIEKILLCSSKLIEKHYNGTESFQLGSLYLRSLKTVLNNPTLTDPSQKLENVYNNCQNTMKDFKSRHHKKTITRTKIFSEVEIIELNNFLNQNFIGSPGLIDFIKKAYSSELDCKVAKGGTLGLSAGLGGYVGGYRRICISPLGRTFELYKIHTGMNAGVGGVFNSSIFGAIKNKRSKKATNHSKVNQITIDHHSAAAFGVGAGENINLPASSIKKVAKKPKKAYSENISATTSPALGLGIVFGLLGVSGEHKREVKGNFDALLSQLML